MYFYRIKDEHNRSPIEEFLDALPAAEAQRVLWMLRLIEESEWMPAQYTYSHKKDETLWEFRINAEVQNYWVLAFKKNGHWILFNADFSTRFQKAPKKEVKRAIDKKEGYAKSFHLLPVSDVHKYITVRKNRDEIFGRDFEKGYLHFKIGSLLRQIREAAELSQKQVSKEIEVTAPAISKMENHPEDTPLSELEDYLKNLKNTLLRKN
ncbi:MAG: helix-turn-helix domain-containing protein [Balneolaceae bacterium]|nr:helix-turn-helix domain-containing protein [Balneolaceae bacterium]